MLSVTSSPSPTLKLAPLQRCPLPHPRRHLRRRMLLLLLLLLFTFPTPLLHRLQHSHRIRSALIERITHLLATLGHETTLKYTR
jgi:hypothetical protein